MFTFSLLLLLFAPGLQATAPEHSSDFVEECSDCKCSSESHSLICEMNQKLVAVIRTVEKRTPLVMKVRRLEEKVEEQRRTIDAMQRGNGNAPGAGNGPKLDVLEIVKLALKEHLEKEKEFRQALEAKLADNVNIFERRLDAAEKLLERMREDVRLNADAADRFSSLLLGSNRVVFRNETRDLEQKLGQLKEQFSDEMKSSMDSIRNLEIRDLINFQSSLNATFRRRLAELESKSTQLEQLTKVAGEAQEQIAILQNSSVKVQESLKEIQKEITAIENSQGQYLLLQERTEEMKNDLNELKLAQANTSKTLLTTSGQLPILQRNVTALQRTATAFGDEMESNVEKITACEDNLQELALRVEGVAYKSETSNLEVKLEQLESQILAHLSSPEMDPDYDVEVKNLIQSQNILNSTMYQKFFVMESRLSSVDIIFTDMDNIQEEYLFLLNTTLSHGKELENARMKCECLQTQSTVKPPVVTPRPEYKLRACVRGEETRQPCITARCLQPIPVLEMKYYYDFDLATLFTEKKGKCQIKIPNKDIWRTPIQLKAGRYCWSLFTASYGDKLELSLEGDRMPVVEVFDGDDEDSAQFEESDSYFSSGNSLLLHLYLEEPVPQTLNLTVITYGDDSRIAVRAICW